MPSIRWTERARRLKVEMVALALAVKFVPSPVLADSRSRATELSARHSLGRKGWLAIATAWIALAAIGVTWSLN